MGNLWKLHKTKIMGGLVTIIQFLQLSNNAAIIEKRIGADGLELLGLVFGIVIIIIGVLNGGPSNPNNSARSHWLIGGLIVLLSLFSMSGCTGQRALMKTTHDRVEATGDKSLYARVTGEMWYAYVKQANAARDSGAITDEQVRALQPLELKARPLVVSMIQAGEAFRAARTAENEAALQKATDDAVKAINDFIDALKAATGATSDAALLDLPPRATPLPAAALQTG